MSDIDESLNYDGTGFALAIIGSLLVGAFTGLGDCTVLGFMKVFPSIVVSGYASGTGMAGIFGSMYYLLFSSVLNLSMLWIFLILIPLNVVYVLLFVYLLKRRFSKLKNLKRSDSVLSNETSSNEDVKNNKSFSWVELKAAVNHVGVFMINLTIVYFLEYMCTTCFSDRAWRHKLPPENTSWWDHNAYKV